MRIAWEEPFGPVVPVMRISSVEQGIEHCNSNNVALQVGAHVTLSLLFIDVLFCAPLDISPLISTAIVTAYCTCVICSLSRHLLAVSSKHVLGISINSSMPNDYGQSFVWSP